MLARLQRLTTGLILAVAVWVAWASWIVTGSAWLACVGAIAVMVSHACVLAMEFLLLLAVGTEPGASRPNMRSILRAWLGECWQAPLIFCWRQPFRSGAEPDHLPALEARAKLPGVILVHGYVCNRGFWNPWLRRLRRQGIACIAVTLEPVFGDLDLQAQGLEPAIKRMTQWTGRPPILVCHSMGGLVARAWMAAHPDNVDRVARVITLGTPHRGTWLARWGHSINARQMRVRSSWLAKLQSLESPRSRARFTCWYTRCDNIVFPVKNAVLEGAASIELDGVAHVGLAFDPRVMNATLEALRDG